MQCILNKNRKLFSQKSYYRIKNFHIICIKISRNYTKMSSCLCWFDEKCPLCIDSGFWSFGLWLVELFGQAAFRSCSLAGRSMSLRAGTGVHYFTSLPEHSLHVSGWKCALPVSCSGYQLPGLPC